MAQQKDTLSVTVEGLDETKEINRGCYGAVYEVRLHGLPCIAKRLHDILVGRGREERVSEEDKRTVTSRFRVECELLSGLRHPNVVQFVGVHYGRDEADISLIMEYMHMDLDQCMKTYPDIPLFCKTSILRDVAYGLAYLHSKNIIHCDLNAGNVLLTESLRAKIADFGVAKLFDKKLKDTATHLTACPGAPSFMAPECLEENAKYDNKLDCFSFGHLVVYVANQQFPSSVDSDITKEDVKHKQMQVAKRRSSLKQMAGGSDHPLYSIAVQCLSDTPDQRPTSRDLVMRMEELCKKQPPPYKNVMEAVKENSQYAKHLMGRLEEKSLELKRAEQRIKSLDDDKADLIQQIQVKNDKIDEQMEQMAEKQSEVDKLKEELSIFQAQAQTYKEDFEQERRDREEKHSEYYELKRTSTIKIKQLETQIETLQNKEKAQQPGQSDACTASYEGGATQRRNSLKNFLSLKRKPKN